MHSQKVAPEQVDGKAYLRRPLGQIALKRSDFAIAQHIKTASPQPPSITFIIQLQHLPSSSFIMSKRPRLVSPAGIDHDKELRSKKTKNSSDYVRDGRPKW
jgi:hypothetical protein